MIRRIIYSFLFVLTSVAILQAGVKVVMSSKSLGCNMQAADNQSTLYLRPDIFRMDMKDKESELSIIFKKSEEKMWILNHKDKSYQSITKEDLQVIDSNLSNIQAMIDEQLKNLPEDQREQMKKMMMQSNPAMSMDKPVITYVKKNDKQDINGWKTQKYEYRENDQLKGIFWVASEDQFGSMMADFQIMKDFSEFLNKHMGKFSLGASSALSAPEQNFEGVPVKSYQMEGGKECTESTIQSVTEETLDNALFKIPDGYRREENPLKGR